MDNTSTKHYICVEDTIATVMASARSIRRIIKSPDRNDYDPVAKAIADRNLSRASDLMIKVLKVAPAADVEPVRHGRWEWFDNTISQRSINRGYKCSVCGRVEEFDDEPFCHCGAKMDAKLKSPPY